MNDENIQNIIHSVSTNNNKNNKEIIEQIQIVVFELDNEEYALKINDLREIINIPNITPIPNSPEFIRGIFNLRGKIIVTVDLEKRFNFSRNNKLSPKHIIITEVENNDFGVVVDRVKEVLHVPVTNIKTAPELISNKIHAEYIDGVVVLEGKDGTSSRIIIMLNLMKLLSDKDLLTLGSVIKANN
jgi:purine-binding chemotaxis protein CheW